jgi:hypothetical protein
MPKLKRQRVERTEDWGQLRLLANGLSKLDRRPQANVLVIPEWIELRTTILQPLAPYYLRLRLGSGGAEGSQRAAQDPRPCF